MKDSVYCNQCGLGFFRVSRKYFLVWPEILMLELFLVCQWASLRLQNLADPKPRVTDVGAGISAEISTSGGRTTSGRPSISGFSAELRPSRVYDLRKDHGAGLLNATNVDRACRYGRWLSISGRRYRNRLTNGSLVIYVTLHFYFRSLTKMAMWTGW